VINAQECSSVKNNNTGIPYTIFDILSQNVFDSVGDPDPYVFGPPGSGSGSFYHQAKIVKKTLISTVL
jgi:hypothetical protein